MTLPAIRPMLADKIHPSDLPTYVKDDDWWTQRKADGHRLLIHITDGDIVVLGRNGQTKSSMVTHAMLGEFEQFSAGEWCFDGEIVGSQLVLFDLPLAQGQVKPTDPFEDRYHVLSVLYDVWQPDHDRVALLPVAKTPDDKLAMAVEAEEQRWEGIMLRHRRGPYQSAKRSTKLLKCKFIKDIDAIVTALEVDGHDNVELTLLDPELRYTAKSKKPGLLCVGQASAIGKKPKPQIGDVWEVRFLYVVDPAEPRLYQPRLMRKRTDKEMHECLADQIDGAFTNKNLNLTKTRSEM